MSDTELKELQPRALPEQPAAYSRTCEVFPVLPVVGPAVVRALLEVCVHPEGFVYEVDVRQSSGRRDLDDVLERAVRRWRYRPLIVDGQATPFCHPIRIVYKVEPREP